MNRQQVATVAGAFLPETKRLHTRLIDLRQRNDPFPRTSLPAVIVIDSSLLSTALAAHMRWFSALFCLPPAATPPVLFWDGRTFTWQHLPSLLDFFRLWLEAYLALVFALECG